MALLPDEKQADVWESDIRDGIAPGNMLMFAHGFSIHFDQIEPGPEVDVGLVAPVRLVGAHEGLGQVGRGGGNET